MRAWLDTVRNLKQNDPQKYLYLLNYLAAHLDANKEYDRLRELFADDSWLRLRIEQLGGVYDGYIHDLELTWLDNANAALKATSSVEQKKYLLDILRYALIRTSINTQARNFSPELVSRAVELDVWSAQQALQIAANTPRDKDRIAHYARLLGTGKLTPAESQQAEERALTALLNLSMMEWIINHVSSEFAEHLQILGPRLSLRGVERVLGHLLSIRDRSREEWGLLALAPQGAIGAIAPYLNEEQAGRLFRAVLDLPATHQFTFYDEAYDEYPLAKGLKQIAPILNTAQARQVVELLPQLEDFLVTEVMRGLAARLDADGRQRVLQIFGPEATRGRAALTLLAPLLAAGEAAAALERLPPPVGEDAAAQLFAALLARLDPERGTKLALRIADASARITALAALAGDLPDDVVESAVARIVRGRRLGRFGQQLLVAALPGLSAVLVKKVCKFTCRLEQEWQRGEVLVALVPYLAVREQVRVKAEAQRIKESSYRSRVLAALARVLPPVDLPWLLDQTDSLNRGNPPDAAGVLAPLLARFDDRAQDAVIRFAAEHELQRALITAVATASPDLSPDRRVRVAAAARKLIVTVDEEDRPAALIEIMSALDEKEARVALDEALRGVWQVGFGSQRNRDTARFLTLMDRGQFEAFLVAAQEPRDAAEQADAYRVLASTLGPSEAPALLQRALASVLVAPQDAALFGSNPRAEVLLRLIPHLDAATCARLEETAHHLSGIRHRARVLAALAPRLADPSARRRTATLALDCCERLEDRDVPDLLAQLAPCLDGELQDRTLAWLVGHNVYDALKVFPVLASYLEGEQLAAATHWARSLDNELRPQGIAPLLPRLTGKERDRVLADAMYALEHVKEGWAWTDEWRFSGALALLPHLSATQRVTALGILSRSIAGLGFSKSEDAQRLVRLLPQLPEPQRSAAIARAYQLLSEEEPNVYYVTKMAPLLPYLEPEELNTTMTRCLDAALTPHDWGTYEFPPRVVALDALAPYLRDGLCEEAYRRVQQLSYRDEREQVLLLAALLPHAAALPALPASVVDAVADYLWALHLGERQWVLKFIGDDRAALPALLGREKLSTLTSIVQDVCGSWQWG